MTSHRIVIKKKLRLFCLRANEHVVFLFNGGIKTTDRAQDCPNVSSYFDQSNRLTSALNKLFIEKEIIWTNGQTDILYDPGLEIEI